MRALPLIAFRGAVLATALAFPSPPAAPAGGIASILQGTAAEKLDGEDVQLLSQAVQRALDAAAEREPVAWQNPKSRHRGDVTVMKSFEAKGMPCRQLRLRNEADGRQGEANVDACKASGEWKLVSSPR
jgi:surface antigen